MSRFDKCPILLIVIFTISIILSKLPYIEAVEVVHTADSSGMEIHQRGVIRDHDAPRELQTRETVLLDNCKLGTAPNLKQEKGLKSQNSVGSSSHFQFHELNFYVGQ